jgi:hypothetical protein
MIQSIELIHTNPSMGPYERIISYSLTNTEAHETEFDRLLKESKINRKFDLETFLRAYKNKDKETIEKILKADYNGSLNEGQTISILKIALVGGVNVQISDLRTTQLSGYYPEFIRYLVKNGNRYESGENELPFNVKEDSLKGFDEIGDTDISI